MARLSDIPSTTSPAFSVISFFFFSFLSLRGNLLFRMKRKNFNFQIPRHRVASRRRNARQPKNFIQRLHGYRRLSPRYSIYICPNDAHLGSKSKSTNSRENDWKRFTINFNRIRYPPSNFNFEISSDSRSDPPLIRIIYLSLKFDPRKKSAIFERKGGREGESNQRHAVIIFNESRIRSDVSEFKEEGKKLNFKIS